MPGLNITSGQFNSAMQNIQNRYIRLELLNYQFQTIDNIEGNAVSGSITIDANSDIRRTANIVLVVQNSSFEIESGGRIWLDKYVRIWVGIESFINNEIEWTNCGIYIIDSPSYQYDASNNTLSLTLLDLMAKLTGIRNGYLPGVPVTLSAGENIRQVIIDTLALGGFTKYIVEEAPSPGIIPNDLEFGQGVTIYELLSALRDIYPDYEIFFDVDGIFYYKPIPTGEGDPVLIDDTLFQKLVISEQIDVDFQDVKNVIEVYGRTHEPEHFSNSTSVNNKVINLNIADVTSYTEDMIYGFTLINNPGYVGYNLQINNLSSYPILLSDGVTPAEIVSEEGEIYYCVQFKGTYWNWLGHLQAYGYAQDDNPESPFYINGTVGIIRLPLFDGEYANCITDDLAQQRAEYELWLHTNINNTVELTCVPFMWCDVNIKVEYTLQRNNISNQYIIKTIDFGLAPSDSMTISMMKFYPNNSIIIYRE